MTYAFANFVRVALRTVLEWVVSITDFPEEVDLVLASKEGGSDAVDGCIAPSLSEIKISAHAIFTSGGHQTS